MIDQIILHYKILEKLGEGGMGEIYKALDTKLDRLVALKFLPYQSNSDEERGRFITEAKTASSLTHQNICTIYSIHEYLNEEGVRQFFIVMEYVEGKTLKDINKDLSIKEIIDIGIQISEGLSAAHEKGIIHRDIKPENIMLRKDGRIQIMDFGLAKLNTVTGVSRLTKAGTTMGTLGYMSPEQVRGFDVDYRTDLFSAGVVLYELLTGESPFKGLHDAAVIYKIVNSDVLPASAIRNDVDPLLDLVILKCLEKDKDKRYKSSKEFAEDLRNLKHLYEKEAININKLKKSLINRVKPKRKTTISPSGSIKIERSSAWFLWIGLILFILTCVIIYKSFFEANPFRLNSNMKTEEIVTSFTDISIPSISADGNWIAFPASDQNDKWDIYLMHTSVKQPKKITNDYATYIHFADISPDGGEVLYNIEDELYIVPSVGGVRKKIAENVVSCEWAPNGKQIGFVQEHYPKYDSVSFWTMKPDGSDKRLIYKDGWKINGRFSFSYSPDGNSIVRARYFNEGYDELFARNLINGKEIQLTFDKADIEDQKWTDKGLILYSSNKSGNTNIWAVPETGGNPFQITKGNGPDLEISSSSDLTKILYYQLRDYSNAWVGDLTKSKFKQITFDERLITDPAISADQKKIAFILHKPAPVLYTSVFIMDRDGSNLRQLTFDKYRNEYLIFSPDGNYLAFTQYQANNRNEGKAFVLNVESSDPPKYVGAGKAGMWLDNNSLVLINKDFTKAVSLDGTKKENIFRDSTIAYPVAWGKFIFYLDLHSKNSGKYYLIKNVNDNSFDYTPKYLFSSNDYIQNIINQDYIYAQDYNNEIWRFNCISGKKEEVGYFINLMTYWGLGFNISSDNKEIIYLEHKRSTKFVIIENAFAEN
ncbi:MAG TPA: protein kinase [Ignavibacteriaceae bacterium]|nr:protein kinase [Ignavibacteriaceae bacterium]